MCRTSEKSPFDECETVDVTLRTVTAGSLTRSGAWAAPLRMSRVRIVARA